MKLLNKLVKVFSLAAIMLCAAFAFNSGEANAMPLSDLEGTYRVIECQLPMKLNGDDDDAIGLLVNLRNTSDGLKGYAQNAVAGFKPGAEVIHDVQISNGTVHCKVTIQPYFKPQAGVIEVYQQGSTLVVKENDGYWKNTPYWTMKRI